MKKLILVSLLLLACGGSGGNPADAERSDTIGIRVLRVDCDADPRCTPEWVVVEAMHRVIEYYQGQLNRKLEISSIETIIDPTPDRLMTLDEFRGKDWRFDYFQKLGNKTNKRIITLVIDKYLTNGKTSSAWAAGKSYVCSLYKNQASVVYSAYTVNPGSDIDTLEKRVEAIAIIAAHELGHAFGSDHYDPPKHECNFMSSYLCNLLGLQTPPSQWTLFDLNKCLSRSATLKINSCKMKNPRRRKKCLIRANLRDLGLPVGEVFE